MTPSQVLLVQRSFEDVRPIAVQAAKLFYDRLFTLDPSLRSLFKGDMEAQGVKLMQTLGTVVQGLSSPDSIRPAVVALGERHRGYGVTEAHYDTVGQALLWTLGQGLGARFTPDVEAAWASAYTMLASTMQSQEAQTP